MRAIAPPSPRVFRYWHPSGWWGDQGNQPHCVAFAWTAWLEDGPVTQEGPVPIVDPSQLYSECQLVDEWPGESYDGTSVRAGAKILQDRGFITSYHWAFDLQTVIDALLEKGPVVVGTNWYSSMWLPDAEGKLKVNGSVVGGHAYVLNGVNKDKAIVRAKNSWGRAWGKGGYFYLTFEDLERLIREAGEACIGTEIRHA